MCQNSKGMKMVGLIMILLCLSISSFAQLFSKGDKVDVDWNGRWYKGSVLEIKDGKYKVHYEGWSATYDEWVSGDKLKKVQSIKPENTLNIKNPTNIKSDAPKSNSRNQFNKGDKVAVKYYSITYEATIVDVKDTQYKVHYEDTKAEDAWVDANDVSRMDYGNTTGGPPAGTYQCYLPMYENTYMGSFVIDKKKNYVYLTGNKGRGSFIYDEYQRTIQWRGGDLAGKVIKTEFSNTHSNGPIITLIFPKGKREGDIQRCLLKK